MAIASAKVTSKGQITLPAKLRERLGIKPGSAEFHRLKKGFVPTYDRWSRTLVLDEDLRRAYPDRGKPAKAGGPARKPAKAQGGNGKPAHADARGKGNVGKAQGNGGKGNAGKGNGGKGNKGNKGNKGGDGKG